MSALKNPQIVESEDIVMTSRALDLLDCFQDGFDGVVQQLAEDYAKQRQPAFQGEIVQVDVDDVRQAGRKLIEIVRAMVDQKQLPPDILARVDVMGDCLNCK